MDLPKPLAVETLPNPRLGLQKTLGSGTSILSSDSLCLGCQCFEEMGFEIPHSKDGPSWIPRDKRVAILRAMLSTAIRCRGTSTKGLITWEYWRTDMDTYGCPMLHSFVHGRWSPHKNLLKAAQHRSLLPLRERCDSPAAVTLKIVAVTAAGTRPPNPPGT